MDAVRIGAWRGGWRLLAAVGVAGLVVALVVLPRWGPGGSGGEGSGPAPMTRPAARLVVPDGEVRIRQWQRTTGALPGSGGQVRLSIGDVTGGRVTVSVSLAGGEALVEERAVSEGEKVGFMLDERQYEIVAEDLRNSLIGEDEVVFTVREVKSQAKRAMSETEKIERLIAAVAELKGAVFVRNGTEHPAADAVEHMRRKWEAGKGRIRTAREFIVHAASKSSLSGEAYRIRFADGTEMTSEAYLLKQLEEMEREGPATAPAGEGP